MRTIILCLAAAAVLALWLRQNGHPLTGVVAGTLLATHPLLSLSIGVETALLLLLAALALWAYGARRYRTVAILLALLILTRTDGILLAGALFACHRIWQWRGEVRALPLAVYPLIAAILLPWFAYSWYAFGSPLPNTLAAKMAQGRSGYFFHFAIGWVYWVNIGDLARAIVLMIAAAAIGGRFALHRRLTFLIPLVAFGILHFVAYLALGVPSYPWYYAPFVMTALVLTGIGVEALLVGGVALCSGQRSALAAIPAAALIGMLLWSHIVAGSSTELTVTTLGRRYDNNRSYREVGAYLRAHAMPGATVAASEIGIVGWESKLPIVDYLGLLSADMAARVGRGDLTSWLTMYQPDYIIVHNGPMWGMERPWRSTSAFADAYRPIATFEGSRGGTVAIWQRQSAGAYPPAPAQP